jgi:hypothetical protein
MVVPGFVLLKNAERASAKGMEVPDGAMLSAGMNSRHTGFFFFSRVEQKLHCSA